MFVKQTSHCCILLIVYVDDIIITRSDVVGVQTTKDWLHSKLHIKDLGKLHYILGTAVSKTTNGVMMQHKHDLDLLEETGCQRLNTAHTHTLGAIG